MKCTFVNEKVKSSKEMSHLKFFNPNFQKVWDFKFYIGWFYLVTRPPPFCMNDTGNGQTPFHLYR